MKIPAGVFDTEPQTLTGIQDGVLDFTIYQDPYLQGFLPVLYFYLYNISGAVLSPPDTDTGLTVLNKGNLSPFLKNSRYQGASSAELYIPRPSGAISNPPATTST
jgi:simple sugar transport system substrate-binding protein